MQDNTDVISRGGLKNSKRILFIFLCILIVFSIFVVYRAVNINSYWLAGFLILLPSYYFLLKKYLHYRKMRNLYRLRENWGQLVTRERKFECIRLLFDRLRGEGEEESFVDEQTWAGFKHGRDYTRMGQDPHYSR